MRYKQIKWLLNTIVVALLRFELPFLFQSILLGLIDLKKNNVVVVVVVVVNFYGCHYVLMDITGL